MPVTAIVLAAGKGLRFSRPKPGEPASPKLLTKIGPQPVIFYSLNILSRHPLIKSIIVAVNAENLAAIKAVIRKNKFMKVKAVVLGGKLRQDSVMNALEAVDASCVIVLIHDAGRPFINKEMATSVIKEAQRYGAAITAVPVKATIKRVVGSGVRGAGYVEKTLDRSKLWEVQTPQAFRRDLVLRAYARFGKIPVTDDAALIEKLGNKVRIVLGSYNNIKITTPEDLTLAEAILRNRLRSSVRVT